MRPDPDGNLITAIWPPTDAAQRVDPRADYGPLNALVRHRLNTEVIAANWEDLLRVAGSLATGKVALRVPAHLAGRVEGWVSFRRR